MAAFATKTDVATRLGRTLTVAEEAQVEIVLEDVADLIREAVGKAEAWMPSPVPGVLKTLSVEKAVGVVVNPHSLASESEQLGSYQHSQTFPRAADIGVFLSDVEERRVRRAIFGSSVASVRVGAVVDEIEFYQGEEYILTEAEGS